MCFLVAVSRSYIWAYACFQFAFVILFAHVFYSIVRFCPVGCHYVYVLGEYKYNYLLLNTHFFCTYSLMSMRFSRFFFQHSLDLGFQSAWILSSWNILDGKQIGRFNLQIKILFQDISSSKNLKDNNINCKDCSKSTNEEFCRLFYYFYSIFYANKIGILLRCGPKYLNPPRAAVCKLQT